MSSAADSSTNRPPGSGEPLPLLNLQHVSLDNSESSPLLASSSRGASFLLSETQRLLSSRLPGGGSGELKSESSWLPTFSSISLLVVFVINVSATALCFMLAAFYQRQPEFPLALVALLGRQLNIANCFVVYLMGKNRYGHAYKFYQPFRGGQRFVTLQICGIFSVVYGTALCSFYMTINESDRASTGVFAVSGFASVMGNLLLFLSLQRFEPAKKAGSVFAVLAASSNTETAIVVALFLGQILLAVTCCYFNRVTWVSMLALLIIQVLCAVLTHFWVGCRRTKGYRVFMVRLNTWRETVAFQLLWALYFVSLWLDLVSLVHYQQVTPLGLGSLVALDVSVGVFLLLLIRTTSFKASQTPSPSSLMDYGGMAVIVVAVVVAVGMTVSILYLQRHADNLDLRQPLFEGLNWSNRDAITFLLYCAQGFLMLLTPIAHEAGCMVCGRSFRFLRGSQHLSVIVLQATSWLSYVVAALCTVLFLATRLFFSCALGELAAVVSIMCMVFAVREYGRCEHRAATASDGQVSPSPTASEYRRSVVDEIAEGAEAPDPLSSAQLVHVINSEMMIAYILSVTSLLIRVVVDATLQEWWGKVEVPVPELLFLANLLFTLSIPLAHLSGRDKGIRVFSPFSGSPYFVALQVLGWSMYAVFVIGGIISSTILLTKPLNKDVYVTAYMTSDYLSILVGVLQFVPLVIITMSIMIEANTARSAKAQYVLAQEAFQHLRMLTARYCESTTSEEERMATQIAFRTLMEPALEHFKIPYTQRELRMRVKRSTNSRNARATTMPRHEPNDGGANTEEKQEEAKAKAKGDDHEHDKYDDSHSEGSVSGLIDSDDTDSDSEFDDDFGVREERQRQAAGARLIMVLACCASASFFIMGAFFYRAHTLALAFAVCGMIICTATCVGLHAGYGVLYHSQSGQYSPFMPFRGGSGYVMRQIAGWSCFAVLLIVSLILGVEKEDVPAPLMLCASFFSVLAPVLIYNSVPYFSTSSSVPTFLEENGEGVVAVLVFAGTLLFGHMYEILAAVFTASGSSPSPSISTFRSPLQKIRQVSRRRGVPFATSVIGIGLAVPCLLLMLNRTTQQWRRAAASRLQQSRSRRSARGQSAKSSRSEPDKYATLWSIVASVLEIATLTVGAVLPILGVYAAYSLTSNYTSVLSTSVESLLPVALYGSVTLVVLSIVPYVARVGVPDFVIYIRFTVVTIMMYGMAAIAAFILLAPMFVHPTYATYYLAFMTFGMTLVGGFKQGRLAVRLFMMVFIGFSTYEVYKQVEAEGVAYLERPRVIASLVGDVLLYAVIAWYMRFYKGRPELTGAQRSPAFGDFACRYLFSDMKRYFNFSVIVDDPSVQMRDDKTQYLFGFHPHGVFPGTALYCTNTNEWREKVGTNPKRHVVLHVASIIFNVPLIRDFNLRLGTRDVSRKTIERTLDSGNSSLIVTGGQAEMLHTEISDTRMTIVTSHHGFVRLAIKHRVPLVPLLSFGEQNIYGLFTIKGIRRITLKLFGFPFPMIPYGRFFMPFPSRTRLTLVVGKPLPIPADAQAENPDDVTALAAEYFKEVRELFYRHRADAGFPEMELYLVDETKHKKV